MKSTEELTEYKEKFIYGLL